MKNKEIFLGLFSRSVRSPCKLYALWEFSGYEVKVQIRPGRVVERAEGQFHVRQLGNALGGSSLGAAAVIDRCHFRSRSNFQCQEVESGGFSNTRSRNPGRG